MSPNPRGPSAARAALLFTRGGAALLVMSSAACGTDGALPGEPPPNRSHGSSLSGEPGPEGSNPGLFRAGTRPDAPARWSLEPLVTRLASDEFDGRKPGTAGHAKARDSIVSELRRCGIPPALPQGYEQSLAPHVGANLIGRIDGTHPTLRDRFILLSAHFDHLGHCDGDICNGAGDNAAGVAAVLAVGCALAKSPPARSVLVVAWDAEEPPTFLTDAMGSEFYAAHPIVPLVRLDGVIVLDLVGLGMWPGAREHIILGTEFSPALADAAQAAIEATASRTELRAFRGGLHLIEETPMGHRPLSDYDAFRDRRVPFAFVTDGMNRHYHEAHDEVGTLDLAKLEAEAELLTELAWRLANASSNPTYLAGGRDQRADALGVVQLLDAALAPRGLVETLGLAKSTRRALEGDRDRARRALATLDRGGVNDEAELESLRTSVQRVVCLASGMRSELICRLM